MKLHRKNPDETLYFCNLPMKTLLFPMLPTDLEEKTVTLKSIFQEEEEEPMEIYGNCAPLNTPLSLIHI